MNVEHVGSHIARRLMICMALASLSACAGTGSMINSPTVDLTGVELTAANFKRQTFRLRFHVTNPNPFPLPIKGFKYQLLFDQVKFAGGSTEGSFTVPASGEESFAISVDLDVLSSTGYVSSLLRGGLRENVTYELKGRLAVDIPFIDPIAFSNDGVVNLTQTASKQFDQ
jgi:LEA14-like dessication related protein